MSEINVVIESLRAARASNEASIKAIDAVLAMLIKATPPTDESECNHTKAVKVATGGGTFRVCECGYQEQY